jgi:hypothetical protein
LEGVATPLGRAGLWVRLGGCDVVEAANFETPDTRVVPLRFGVRRLAMPDTRREGVPWMVSMGKRELMDARKLEKLPSSAADELEPGRLRPCDGGRMEPSEV